MLSVKCYHSDDDASMYRMMLIVKNDDDENQIGQQQEWRKISVRKVCFWNSQIF